MVILYDNQYNGRFWPCVECWSSFQVATPNGLESEKEDYRLRAAFVCVAASEGTEAQAQSFMEKQWRHVTSEQAVSRLLGPDLLVTNKKDKEVQVHVLKSLNKQVAEFVSTFLTRLRAKLETLSPRDWLDEASHVGLLGVPFGLDLVTDVVATTHRGNSRVSSSTREELVTFIRSALSRSTDLNLNSLFPVMVETLKLEHGGCGVFRVRPSRWANAHGLWRQVRTRLLRRRRGTFEVAARPLGAVPCAPFPVGECSRVVSDNFARVFSDAGEELLKLQHGGNVLFRVRPSRWANAHGLFRQIRTRLLRRRRGTFEVAARRFVCTSVCALPGGRMLTGCSGTTFARVFSDDGVELLKLQHDLPVRIPCAPFRVGECSRVVGTDSHASSPTPERNF